MTILLHRLHPPASSNQTNRKVASLSNYSTDKMPDKTTERFVS